jgi:vacuolar-type H+-ATPase subunit C/Vma6
MTNILIAFRCQDAKQAEDKYLPTGTLTNAELLQLFETDNDKIRSAFKGGKYAEFIRQCLEAKEKGLPFTQAEKTVDGYDAAYFSAKKYELKKSEPFLYYVYRRKSEIANVRIVIACLLVGLREQDIKRRLRDF